LFICLSHRLCISLNEAGPFSWITRSFRRRQIRCADSVIRIRYTVNYLEMHMVRSSAKVLEMPCMGRSMHYEAEF
jgi:hypothetical protein